MRIRSTLTQLKKILAVLLLISCVTIIGRTAHAQLKCAELFASQHEKVAETGRTVESLITRIEALEAKFKVNLNSSDSYGPMYGKFTGSFLIEVYRGEESIGRIRLARVGGKTRIPVYTSHIQLLPKARGLGLGTALYAMAGRLAYLKGGILISTNSPSESARAVWTELEKSGWAKQIQDFTWNSSRNPGGKAPFVFMFNAKPLENRLDDFMEGLKEGLDTIPLFSEPSSKEYEVPNLTSD
ncbi:MAG: hypothetical protein V4596_09235 [Bdellovibrionota bacterium]